MHMILEIRSGTGGGKLLFAWNPGDDIIDIINKGFLYRIKLVKQGKQGAYYILDKRPKSKATQELLQK